MLIGYLNFIKSIMDYDLFLKQNNAVLEIIEFARLHGYRFVRYRTVDSYNNMDNVNDILLVFLTENVSIDIIISLTCKVISYIFEDYQS